MINNGLPHPNQIADIWRSMQGAGLNAPTPTDIAEHAAKVYGELPHPSAPEIKVKDYPGAERVAGMLFSSDLQGKRPHPDQVRHANEMLSQAQMSPAEFEQVWSVAKPVSNRLLGGRDPAITDLVHLKSKTPSDIHGYYLSHPMPGYEEVTAGQVVRHWRAAEAVARQYGRQPNMEEVTRFAAAGYTADDMARHYSGSGG